MSGAQQSLGLPNAGRIESGEVVLAGGERLGRSPRRSIDAGLAMIPESRKDEGLIFGRSSIENASLSRLGGVQCVRDRPPGRRAPIRARGP